MLSCWAASYYWKVWRKSGKRLIWKFKVVSRNVLHCFASSIIHAMLCGFCTLPWKLRAQGVSRFALAFFKASACTLATAKLAWSLWVLLLSKNLLLSSCREVSFPRIVHVFSGNSTTLWKHQTVWFVPNPLSSCSSMVTEYSTVVLGTPFHFQTPIRSSKSGKGTHRVR